MAQTSATIDKTRRRIGATALKLLNETPFVRLDLAEISTVAKVETTLARRLFPHPMAATEKGMADLDEAVMLRLADDLAEDPDASVHDKILEGLIMRFEAWRPYRRAIDNLNHACLSDPLLAAMLVGRLTHASERVISLAGGDASGLGGMMRIKGLSAVILSCQRHWLTDDSPDMAATQRILDKRLKQAEGVAISLRLIRPQQQEEGASDGG